MRFRCILLCASAFLMPVHALAQNNDRIIMRRSLSGGPSLSSIKVLLPPSSSACGASDGQSFPSAPASGLCLSGIYSTVVSKSNSFTWSCTSVSSVAYCNAVRSKAINGICGSSNGALLSSSPASNLCGDGSLPVVATSPATFDWVCLGSKGGVDAICSSPRSVAVDGVCGSSNGFPSTTKPSSGLCSNGLSSPVLSNATTYNWSCSGIYGGASMSCSSPRLYASVGVCGFSNGSSQSFPPKSGLCSTGAPSAVLIGVSSYDWSCSGLNGGVSASCFASKLPGKINGLCGSANGGVLSSPPSTPVELCSSGNSTAVIDNGPGASYQWSCAGVSTSASCVATNGNTPSSCVMSNSSANYAAIYKEAQKCANAYGAGSFGLVSDGTGNYYACHNNIDIPDTVCSGGVVLTYSSSPACQGSGICP